MASIRFRNLEREVKRLRKELLPATWDPLGNYSDRVRTRTRAFVILCHAAVEDFLEVEAKRITKAAQDLWDTKERVSKPLAFLVGTTLDAVGTPQDPKHKSVDDRMKEAIKRGFEAHYKTIKDNNGVKAGSVLTMFSPLGFPTSAFGTILLPELDSFGSTRGDHAHRSSATVAVTSVLDPETEFKRVTGILVELEKVDSELRKFERAIR